MISLGCIIKSPATNSRKQTLHLGKQNTSEHTLVEVDLTREIHQRLTKIPKVYLHIRGSTPQAL